MVAATALVEQQLPYRDGDRVLHRRWTVDLHAAARLSGLPAARLLREATEMAAHFPRWILSVSQQRTLVRCEGCEGVLAFDDGIRCTRCRRVRARFPGGAGAAWFGVMPPIGIGGLTTIRDRLKANPPPQHVVGYRDGIGDYLLVPLVVTYPREFPAYPLNVHYLPEFKSIPGIPREELSHAFHMIGEGRMCLFAAGEWTPETTAREVLQQRAYAHVVKFLNFANGKRNAFAVVS